MDQTKAADRPAQDATQPTEAEKEHAAVEEMANKAAEKAQDEMKKDDRGLFSK